MSLLLLFGGGGGGPAPITGTVAQTLGNVVPTASGVYADVAGTVARTLGNVTSTATGISNAAVTGTVAVTLGNVSGVADTEGYTTPAARITFIGEHRLALPPPPDISDPKVGDYLEYLRQHTQDAYNRLADDLARLQRDASAVADIANTAVYQSDSITITNSITSGDITIENSTDPLVRAALDEMFSNGIAWGGTDGVLSSAGIAATTLADTVRSLGSANFAGQSDDWMTGAYVTFTVAVINNPCTVELAATRTAPGTADVDASFAPKMYLPLGIYPLTMYRGPIQVDSSFGTVGFEMRWRGVGGTSNIAFEADGRHTYRLYNHNITMIDDWEFAKGY